MSSERQRLQPWANGAVPLSRLREGEWGRLRFIAGGRGLVARTLALGLVPGTPVWVVRAVGGPVIIAVRGSRLALGRMMAQRIWVEPLAAQPSHAVEPTACRGGATGAGRVAPMGAGSAR